MKLKIKWFGTFGNNTGYNKINREFVRRLYAKQIPISIDIADIDNIRENNLYDNLKGVDRLYNDTDNYDIGIYSKVYTDKYKLDKNKYNILYWMTETSDLLNVEIERLKQFNEIWTPSDFCLDVYNKYDINIPIYKISPGIDSTVFKYQNYNKEKPFRFLSVFSWSKRKGFDVLLKSYLDSFSRENVILTLVTKIFGSESVHGTKSIIESIENIKSEYQYKKTPIIELITQDITDEQLAEIYNNSHCFVLPTRGEGFCFPLLESAFCKLPIITTNFSGHLDYLNKNNSTLIDVDGFSVVGDDNFFNSQNYNTLKFPTLGKQYKDQLKENMVEIFNNYEQFTCKSEFLYEQVRLKYFWEDSTKKIIDRLNHINM